MNEFVQIHRLGDMTGAAFAQVAPTNPVILLPLGSHEDHGPHLPMGDYLLAEPLAVRIAEAATQAGVKTFVAPCLPFGVADYFGCSPGAMALSASSFRAVLSDLLASLLRHGLTNIVILNGHGGNVPVIHEVTLDIKRERDLVIPSFYLWKIARQLMAARLGPDQEGRFGHGAEPLLSLTKAIRGDTVQPAATGRAAAGSILGLPVSNFGTVNFLDLAIEVPAEFDQVPRDATVAAWPLASAELGTATADALVDAAAKFVVYFANAASISGVSKSRNTESDST
jgi:creatinine amidohydrolase